MREFVDHLGGSKHVDHKCIQVDHTYYATFPCLDIAITNKRIFGSPGKTWQAPKEWRPGNGHVTTTRPCKNINFGHC